MKRYLLLGLLISFFKSVEPLSLEEVERWGISVRALLDLSACGLALCSKNQSDEWQNRARTMQQGAGLVRLLHDLVTCYNHKQRHDYLFLLGCRTLFDGWRMYQSLVPESLQKESSKTAEYVVYKDMWLLIQVIGIGCEWYLGCKLASKPKQLGTTKLVTCVEDPVSLDDEIMDTTELLEQAKHDKECYFNDYVLYLARIRQQEEHRYRCLALSLRVSDYMKRYKKI